MSANVTKDDVLRRVRWIREYLETHADEDGHLPSIDEAARAANNAGLGTGRGEVARIRRDLAQERARLRTSLETGIPLKLVEAVTKNPSLVVPRCPLCRQEGHWPAQCPNPPLVVPADQQREELNPGVEQARALAAAKELETMDQKVAELGEHAAQEVEARKRTKAGNDVRKTRVNEWLDAEPGLTPQQIQGRLHDKYGVGLDSYYVYGCCRTAREMAGLEPLGEKDAPERPGGTREALPPTPAEALRAATAAQGLPTTLVDVGDLEGSLHAVMDLVKLLLEKHPGLEVTLSTQTTGEVTCDFAVRKMGRIQA